MSTTHSVRLVMTAIATAGFLGGICSTTHAVTIRFNGVEIGQNGTMLAFPAQQNPRGAAWDTTAGTLILNLTAGPPDPLGRPTTTFASLTLTGPQFPNGNFGDFEVIYDPAGGNNPLVNIELISPRLAGGRFFFDPILPLVQEFALLGGEIVSQRDLGQNAGVTLTAFAFGGGQFGQIGPFRKKGKFRGSIGPIMDNRPVTRLRGVLSFSFAGLNAGDKVIFPGSVNVRATNELFVSVPEPSSTLGLLALGTLGASSALKCNKKQARKGDDLSWLMGL